jgi:hypothetical protein
MKINASRRLKAYSYDSILSEDLVEKLIYDDFQDIQRVYTRADKMKDEQEREDFIVSSLQSFYEDSDFLDEYFAYKPLSRVVTALMNNSSDSRVVSYLREKLNQAL